MQIFDRKNKKLGFTLIELLVVIAIIGILAAIVLISLQGARERARDGRIISNMSQLRTVSEIFYAAQSPNSYTGLCADTTHGVDGLLADIITQGGTPSGVGCHVQTGTGAGNSFCIEYQLNNNQFWCVDNVLSSRQSSTSSCVACDGVACVCN